LCGFDRLFVNIVKIGSMVSFATLIKFIELTELIKFMGFAEFENQSLATLSPYRSSLNNPKSAIPNPKSNFILPFLPLRQHLQKHIY